MLAGVFNVYGTGVLHNNPHISLPLWWKLVLECWQVFSMYMELESCITIHILLYLYGGSWCWNAGRCFQCIWNWSLAYQSTYFFFTFMVEFGAGMLAGVLNVYGTGALHINPHPSLPIWWNLVLECWQVFSMCMELEPCIAIHILLHYIYGGIWCWNASRCFQ